MKKYICFIWMLVLFSTIFSIVSYAEDIPMYTHVIWDYDGENLTLNVSVQNCNDDCLAKIELRNLYATESEFIYEEISQGTTEKIITIPLTNYGNTYSIYFSVESIDKMDVYIAPKEVAFFTPEPFTEEMTEDDFVYLINSNNEAEITMYTGTETVVVIPDTLGGYPVTALKAWSFCGLEMTELHIGKSLKNIGYGALTYTFMLENIIVDSENNYFAFEGGALYSKDKTKIVHYLLSNTEEKFVMPETVEIIGAHAFEANETLKELVLSPNIKKIERQGLAIFSIEDELILPQGLEIIGSGALEGGYTKVHIPQSVEYIAPSAFGRNEFLKEITVDEENKNYSSENGVLYNKDKTVLIKYPALRENYSFIIPDTVIELEEGCFAFVPKLAKLTIPDSVKIMKQLALADLENIKMIFYLGTEAAFNKIAISEFNDAILKLVIGNKANVSYDCYQYEITPTNTAIVGTTSDLSGYVILPEEVDGIPVDTIGKYAFRNCKNITELEFSKYINTFNVTYGFEGLTNLERFIVNEENKTFKADENGLLYNYDMTNLVRVPQNTQLGDEFVIPDNIEIVARFAFSQTKFNKIIINENLKRLYYDSFLNMSLLKEFVVNNNEYFISKDGVLYTADMQTLISYPAGKEDTLFTVPDSVKKIDIEAFYKCSAIKNINLPLNLKDIGDFAFYGCQNLQSITIPSSVTAISTSAFHNCTNLFAVTFGNTLTNIEENAFKNCNGLMLVYYIGTEQEYSNINIHESNTNFKNVTVKYVKPQISIYNETVNSVAFVPMYISKPADIIIAYYKDGVLDNLEKREYQLNKVESVTLGATFNPEYDTIKIMAWNDLSGLKALCKPLIIGKE